jgi:two-component system cell cycle response regulator
METPMSDKRIDLPTGLGIIGLGASLLTARKGRRAAALVAGSSAAAAAFLAHRDGGEVADLEARVSSMNEQIRQLENAVAAQVQGRMAAEEAVKSLSTQLAATEKRAVDLTNLPTIVAESGVGGEGLTDVVTGLFNHDYFLVALDSRIAAARRHLRPVAVALLDVVEGRNGEERPAADARLVAGALRETLRESDTATRLRDGRFGVVLEDTPENGAIWTIERVRRRIAEEDPDLTMWAGVACYPAHAFDVPAIIQRADAALDAAREWHQDRIEVATAD